MRFRLRKAAAGLSDGSSFAPATAHNNHSNDHNTTGDAEERKRAAERLAEAQAEMQRLRAALQDAKDAGAAHQARAAQLEERVGDLAAELRLLKRAGAANDDLDLHFDRWHCFMCCLPKDLKVIPHGQLRTVKIARGSGGGGGGGGSGGGGSGGGGGGGGGESKP